MKRNETSTSKINISMNIPESNEIIKDVHKSTDIISSLIHEYLLKRDYQKTIDAFQEELITKIKQKNYYKIAFSNITETNLLKFFNYGRKAEFFKSWKRIIPNHIRLREPPLQKLEFYLQVYFAIYPLLYRDGEINSNKTIQETMDEFKIFLEKKDSDYSKSNEFLQYYALPYVQNVKTHPTYSKLFQPEWAVELKDKIHLAIKTYLPNIKYPVLYDLVNESNANAVNNNSGNNLNVSNISHKANMMKTFLENVISEADYEYFKKKLKKYDKFWYFVIRFMAATGARVSELLSIKAEHVKLGFLDLYSKGGKIRRIYIPQKLQSEALLWIEEQQIDSGFLFVNRYGDRFTPRGIAAKLKIMAKKFGIDEKVVYPHSFRHRFAKNFLCKYNDISFLADLMGHESIETTRIYLRKTSTEQRIIVDKIVDW
jgi:integrase